MAVTSAPSSAIGPSGITVAIPTFGREQVLVDTIGAVLALEPAPEELLVLDQTPVHEAATEAALSRWDRCGAIRWVRLKQPSITKAMNQALLSASQPLVLFLDDDIVPDYRLIGAHRSAHASEELWAVVGQVLQPGQEVTSISWHPSGDRLKSDLEFPFHSDASVLVYACMGGNLSVRRDRILSMGGFDENFVGAAYRFEAEFARRVWRSGGRILFDPAASIRHLQAERGGTRSYGNHLRSIRPAHSMGDYYFALSQGLTASGVIYCLNRLTRSTMTRYHLAHPWWIVPKMIGELCGLACAMRLAVGGPRLLPAPAKTTTKAAANDESRQLCSQELLP